MLDMLINVKKHAAYVLDREVTFHVHILPRLQVLLYRG